MASGGVDALCQRAGAHDAADVGRDHHPVPAVEALLDVADHHGGGEQVVGRDVEEALDLPGMKVEGQDPVDAGVGDQVGDELGRDRRPRSGLTVLAGIAEIGDRPP